MSKCFDILFKKITVQKKQVCSSCLPNKQPFLCVKRMSDYGLAF